MHNEGWCYAGNIFKNSQSYILTIFEICFSMHQIFVTSYKTMENPKTYVIKLKKHGK